ncbi:hypothetical protein ACJIZ3_015774 [Penstemon smallii]|uniref:COBRA C-terminal domain-containing protein n=1 Tax=Penstemon smallii TaxID=265156 RepID=A0ABD3RRC7_9LAMI
MDWIPCLLLIKNRSLNVFLIVLLVCFVSVTYGYDPLDPNGNITIRWDVRLSIINYQLFRHIEFPGWKLSFTWPGDEVLWDILGAEATEQGNCSAFKGRQLPHCCLKEPIIIDLLPAAPYNKQVGNCCRGGVVSSMIQDPGKSIAYSNASVITGIHTNFYLGLGGYTCGDPLRVPPTKFFEDQGRRRTQAVATWNVTCSYSQLKAPTCCVSLSAFYNDTIVPCPKCSSACRGQTGSKRLILQHNEQPKPVVQCSDYMCPIKVHWHVKQSYREYWRDNCILIFFILLLGKLVIHHILHFTGDTGMFYGIQYYNDMLLQSGKSGNDGLLQECVMPSPDDYPRLPSPCTNSSFYVFLIVTDNNNIFINL